MKKAAIVACSNAQQSKYRPQIGELITFLQSIGIETELSECIYSDDSVFSGTPGDRGAQLMKMFRTPEIEEIYDISGGDVANQILDELDYKVIAASKAIFWGYSDLSTVINAIYTMTGKESVLYQVKNMVRGDTRSKTWCAGITQRFSGSGSGAERDYSSLLSASFRRTP